MSNYERQTCDKVRRELEVVTAPMTAAHAGALMGQASPQRGTNMSAQGIALGLLQDSD